jgi:D-glycero-D-manno-heptose 1,7-bisphosphate phosphatase
VRDAGGALARIYHCPHHPDVGCDCRKPKAALLRRVERDFSCSLVGTPLVGDRVSDLDAAAAVGARAMLVRTGTGAATERALGRRSVEVFDDLSAAARAILGEE